SAEESPLAYHLPGHAVRDAPQFRPRRRRPRHRVDRALKRWPSEYPSRAVCLIREAAMKIVSRNSLRRLAFVSVVAIASSLTQVSAGALDALTSKDASSGLRAALGQGIDLAVTQLGATDGFLKDPKVTIPLPPALQKADRALRVLGMSGDADNLKAAMNHAAEAAVAQAKPVFKDALTRMSIADAKSILTGGD